MNFSLKMSQLQNISDKNSTNQNNIPTVSQTLLVKQYS
jgi:hypothetical protein